MGDATETLVRSGRGSEALATDGRSSAKARSRVGDEESAGAAECRLRVACETLIGIVPRAQSVRIGRELRKQRIKLAAIGDRRSVRHRGAIIAGRLELSCAQDTFTKRRKLVGADGRAGRWMWADHRGLRNLDAAKLQHAGGVLITAPDARILLGERLGREKVQRDKQNRGGAGGPLDSRNH